MVVIYDGRICFVNNLDYDTANSSVAFGTFFWLL